MKRTSLLVACTFIAIAIIAETVTPASALPAYYAELQGKSGKALFDAVHVVTKLGYNTQFSYSDLWTTFGKTDLRENGYVWDIYSDCEFEYQTDQDRGGASSTECTFYNREHSIPKSWFGGSTSANTPGTDIFHLYPTSKNVNSLRSNHPYGEVASSSNTTTNGSKYGNPKDIYVDGKTIVGNTIVGTVNQNVFEPVDEYKGDLARSYMATMIKWAGDYQAFNSSEGATIFSGAYTVDGYYGLTKYGVALLMKWHRQDPVSKKEVDRNNGIQETQGNRNPFIDYPYLAEYIWGEKAGESVDMDDLITAYDERFVLGESNGYLEDGNTVNPQDQYTITWMVNGETYAAGNPTTTVNKGGVITVLPSAPVSCDGISNHFVGWSEYEIIGTTDVVPTDLFSTVPDAPTIVQNTTFYAVFANLEETLVTTGDPMTYLLTMDNTEEWTLSGLIKDTKHWRMVTNSYIELQDKIDASQISGIMINMRTYGGIAYNTIEFKIDDTKVGELKASNNSLNDYVWEPDTAVVATGKLRFTSTKNTSELGPALSRIEITMNAPSYIYTYSRYLTSCGPSADIVEVKQPKNIGNKLLVEGQLFIECNGIYYNTLGQIVNR